MIQLILSKLKFIINISAVDNVDDCSCNLCTAGIVIITLFILSHSLKLCFFYRLQCLLSAAPQIFVLIDEYLYEFGTLSVSLATVFMGTVFLLSMINVYRVFISK